MCFSQIMQVEGTVEFSQDVLHKLELMHDLHCSNLYSTATVSYWFSSEIQGNQSLSLSQTEVNGYLGDGFFLPNAWAAYCNILGKKIILICRSKSCYCV